MERASQVVIETPSSVEQGAVQYGVSVSHPVPRGCISLRLHQRPLRLMVRTPTLQVGDVGPIPTEGTIFNSEI